MPNISVIVPVYNVEAYLEKCVGSILKQTMTDFELLLIDDGSTDSSGKLCDILAKLDSRIQVIHQENGGLGAARNTGITSAVGDWLLFVDSDDFIEPCTLEIAMEAGESAGAEIVVFGFQSVNTSGGVIEQFVDPIPKGQAFSASESEFSVEEGNSTPPPSGNPPPTQRLEVEGLPSAHADQDVPSRPDMLLGAPVAWNKLYRRSLFMEAGIRYPGRVWYEDIRTTPKLLVFAKKIVYIEDILYNYLMREGSITKNSKADRNVEIIDAFTDLTGYFKENNLFETFHNELEYLTLFHVYITASVRVLRIDPKHQLLSEFRQYLLEEFPRYKENLYLNRLDKNKRLVKKLLERKMYRTIRLMFKVKSGLV